MRGEIIGSDADTDTDTDSDPGEEQQEFSLHAKMQALLEKGWAECIFSPHPEKYGNYHTPYHLKCIHDLCLVRAFKV
jgi:hypothetical protein